MIRIERRRKRDEMGMERGRERRDDWGDGKGKKEGRHGEEGVGGIREERKKSK